MRSVDSISSMLYVICSFSLYYYFFFFFKQKTAYEMRISDWSSDVCSSDLHEPAPALDQRPPAALARLIGDDRPDVAPERPRRRREDQIEPPGRDQIARERHDHLRRQRDARRFDRHQDQDAEIARRRDDGNDDARKPGEDMFDHGDCACPSRAGFATPNARRGASTS